MKTDKVLVKNSHIEGKGVFAEKDFKKGEIVLHWDTKHSLPKKKIDMMSDDEKNISAFLDDKCIEIQEPERYVNHSCEPNTTVNNFCDIAIRDIKKGEEITADYSKELPYGIHIDCKCNSKKCKKIIRNSEIK